MLYKVSTARWASITFKLHVSFDLRSRRAIHYVFADEIHMHNFELHFNTALIAVSAYSTYMDCNEYYSNNLRFHEFMTLSFRRKWKDPVLVSVSLWVRYTALIVVHLTSTICQISAKQVYRCLPFVFDTPPYCIIRLSCGMSILRDLNQRQSKRPSYTTKRQRDHDEPMYSFSCVSLL